MDAPWLRVGRELLGIKEVAGSAADPRILELFRLAGFPQTHSDETPWCAAFVGGCLRLAGRSNRATLAAVGYLEFGADLGKNPELGCIVVLKPLVPHSTGHVGFYVGETAKQVVLLGGNQHNSVNESKFAKDAVRAYRWPVETAPIATSDLIKNITELDPGYAAPAQPQPVVATQPGTYAAFESVVPIVEAYENGYVDNPKDPGGPTNMGITLGTLQSWRGHPVSAEDVRNLSRAEERQIYKTRYWDKICGDQLPAPCALMAFNAAVLHGPSRACRFLQQALNEQGMGVDVDGEVGPQTLLAVGRSNLKTLVHDYAAAELAALKASTGWSSFAKGWTRRLDDVEAKAEALAEIEPAPPAPSPQPAPAPKAVPAPESKSAPPPAPGPAPAPSRETIMTADDFARAFLEALLDRPPQGGKQSIASTDGAEAQDPVNQWLRLVLAALQSKQPDATAQAATLQPISSSPSAPPVLTPIDMIFPAGQWLAGKKTALAVIAYMILAILQSIDVVGTATGAAHSTTGAVLTTLIGGLGGLGLISKIDRVVKLLGLIAVKPM
jgi:uncharacterized protein (TIGR02594 family)